MTHHMMSARTLGDELIFVDGGRVLAHGTVAALTSQSANNLIETVGGDVSRISSAGADTAVAIERMADNAGRVLADLESGRGTIGKLLTDDTLYTRIEPVAIGES